MPKYVKPNGTEIEINEESEEYAKSIGWTKYKAPKKEPKKEAK